MHLLLAMMIAFTLFLVPSTGFGERPPLLMEEAGGLTVYMDVMETSNPDVIWKGETPKAGDTHHLVFLFRNSATGRAENTDGIKLKVRTPSGATIFDAPVKQFIIKGIASYGHFFNLKEDGMYEATVTFSHGGKEDTVNSIFISSKRATRSV